MSEVVFSRLLTAPATLQKGAIALTRNYDNTATLYVGNNYNEPTRLAGNGEVGKGAVCAWKSSVGPSSTTGALTNYNASSVNDGSFNQTTGIYTAPAAGLYYVSFSGFKDEGSATCSARLMKNSAYTGIRGYTSVTGYASVSFSALIPLAALDTLSILITDGNIYTNESCYLTIYKIR